MNVRLTGFFVSMFFLLILQAANGQAYSRAKIYFERNQITEIAQLGIALDHIHQGDNFVEGDFSALEIQICKDAGYRVDILVADAQKFYQKNQVGIKQRTNAECIADLDELNYATPENFLPGSMKGNFTFSEMEDQLDLMQTKYPHLVTKKTPIEGFTSHEGRPIYWLRISDNPDKDEDEPEILYTALHHSREPVSLTQLIYFMWYVLENYDSDNHIQYLLNHTELYFLPCVNPDGYVYNESIFPQGGGLWRKNRRKNEDGTYGVDLNRNYGHQWGLDNVGSSNKPSSETYRGIAPFSEPEIQAVRKIVMEHDFKIALNYHTFGGFLIYPYGYTDLPTDEAEVYMGLANLLTRENRYVYGTGIETLSYYTNGDSDDWMYGETENKNRIFALTPEVGHDEHGFWPNASDVEMLCKASLKQNLDAANFLLNSGLFIDESEPYLTKSTGTLPFRLTKLGFEEVGLQMTLNPITPNISFTNKSKFYILDVFSNQQDEIEYTLSSSIQDGEVIRYSYVLDNGSFQFSDTITKHFRVADFGLEDSGEIKNWSVTGLFSQWDMTQKTFYSSPSSLTDSPNGNYLPYSSNEITLIEPVSLTGDSALLTFKAKWDIQHRYDYMIVEISTDGSNYEPLCGSYSLLGGPNQRLSVPVYSGRQTSWITEMIDLSEFIGEEIQLRFSMVSNINDTRDGVYLDDIKILSYREGMVTGQKYLSDTDFQISHFPNPVSQNLYIQTQVNNPQINPERIQFFDLLGKEIKNISFEKEVKLDVSGWSKGLYFYVIQDNLGRKSKAGKIIVE